MVPSEKVKVAEPSPEAFQAQAVGLGTVTVTDAPEVDATTPAPTKFNVVAPAVNEVPSSLTSSTEEIEGNTWYWQSSPMNLVTPATPATPVGRDWSSVQRHSLWSIMVYFISK